MKSRFEQDPSEHPLFPSLPDMEIMCMQREHIGQIAELEQLCFAMPWSEESFEDELTNPLATYVVVVLPGDGVVAYGGFWLVLDEAHVTNIAVHPDHRRIGIGRGLMLSLMQKARERSADRMTLEVSESNTGAQALYAELDFKTIGRRKGYYGDTGEDALILWNDALGSTLQRFDLRALPIREPLLL